MRAMTNRRDLRARLARGLLLGDGATGTELYARGLTRGECAEEWNATHPDAVRAVYASYVEAGSEVVSTNTFGGSALKLRAYGLDGRTEELNEAAARLSREAVGEARYVAGSVGPTGEILEPWGELPTAVAVEAYARQVAGLREGGVDGILVETMIALEEALAAVEAARTVAPELPVFVTMTFDASGRTPFGITPEEAVTALEAAGASGVGANCGLGGREAAAVLERFVATASVPAIAQPNAGMPQLVAGETIFPEAPEETAAHAARLVALGVRWIGGCCGTSPAHIREVARLVRAGT